MDSFHKGQRVFVCGQGDQTAIFLGFVFLEDPSIHGSGERIAVLEPNPINLDPDESPLLLVHPSKISVLEFPR